MRLVIVDYNMGNTCSIANAFERLGVHAELTADISRIESADRVVLPGVGAGLAAMQAMEGANLVSCMQGLKQPVLGICLGMQIMGEYLEEGGVPGLGLIPVRVERLENMPKSPQIGWNTISSLKGELFAGVEDGSYVYYANSYGVQSNPFTTSTTEFGDTISGSVSKDNFYGCQFHPEKSGKVGARILENFIKLQR